MNFYKPWLKSAPFDLSFILLPSLFSVLFAFIYSSTSNDTTTLPLWAWLLFVLAIDVSHVYSTLFRTYFNSNEWAENKTLLTLIPIATWLMGIFLYAMDAMIFWRVLAYVAVFHFIRQQYGFLRLYTRGNTVSIWDRRLDSLVIYTATLYPILFWHSSPPRNFQWFIDGDFWTGLPSIFTTLFGFFYISVACAYIIKEFKKIIKGETLNIPKNLIVLGTAASWYVGIVLFNGDMVFTATNVVSHGIPYMALVWLYGERQKEQTNAPLILGKFSYSLFFSKLAVPVFLGALLFFAYIEEGLWSGLIWREHLAAFGLFTNLPPITATDTLTWLVPLLTLPQATHYVLDGFIWKLKDSGANWQQVLFAKK